MEENALQVVWLEHPPYEPAVLVQDPTNVSLPAQYLQLGLGLLILYVDSNTIWSTQIGLCWSTKIREQRTKERSQTGEDKGEITDRRR